MVTCAGCKREINLDREENSDAVWTYWNDLNWHRACLALWSNRKYECDGGCRKVLKPEDEVKYREEEGSMHILCSECDERIEREDDPNPHPRIEDFHPLDDRGYRAAVDSWKRRERDLAEEFRVDWSD